MIKTLFFREFRRIFLSTSLLFFLPLFIGLNGIQLHLLLSVYQLKGQNVEKVRNTEGFLLNPQDSLIRPYFGNMSLLLLFFIPLLTMKAFSEEKGSGELDLLRTYPISDFQILFGKYLAYLGVFLLQILLSCAALKFLWGPFPDLEIKEFIFPLLGVVGVGFQFLSIGLFSSSLTANQAVSALVSFFLCGSLWICSVMGEFFNGFSKLFLQHLCPVTHLDFLLQNIVQTRDLVYFLTTGLFFFFLTLFYQDQRHWVSHELD